MKMKSKDQKFSKVAEAQSGLNVKKIIFVFAGIFLFSFMLVAVLNYFLNPLTYNKASLDEAGSVLASGKGIAFPEPSLDFRGLRRSHIEQMSETPDIVIFSGSRWQEATAELAPGKKLYNSFVSSDHWSDMLAIAQILEKNNRLPKVLVLSVRFTTFNNIEDRTKSSWKTFTPEYREMAKKLGLKTPPWWKTFYYEKWFNLVSLDALIERISDYREVPVTWQTAGSGSGELLDVIEADGGIRFSERHNKKFDLAYVANDAQKNAAKDVGKRISINQQSLKDLEVFLEYMEEKNVRIIFAQTPFHEEYYDRIKGSKYFNDLQKVEEEMNQISSKRGISVVGGYDPRAIPCAPEEFRDYHHATFDCIKRIFDKIPDLD